MLLYNTVVLLYGFVIRLAAFKKTKAKLWVSGRKDWQVHLKKAINKLNSDNIIWIHCASLGEFEQGRPLIEALKKQKPNYKIVLSFFSPSGYEIQKNYEVADIVTYLPLDTKTNARNFLNIVKPTVIVFVKYEFWINFLNEIHKRQIKAYLISAVFKNHHPFFKWYGGIFIKSLKAFRILFVQDENSARLLKSINIQNVQITGDTRIDRVLEIKESCKPINKIQAFKKQLPLIVAGSTWPPDDDLILNAFTTILKTNNAVKLIIAPHEIDKRSIDALTKKLSALQLTYCLFSDEDNEGKQVLVLNTMGTLSSVYAYAQLAYVGGGFTQGLHNILEPIVFGIPVVFSDKKAYSKYNEAVDLVKIGAAFPISEALKLVENWNKYLNNAQNRTEIEKIVKNYFHIKGNITQKLINAMDFV